MNNFYCSIIGLALIGSPCLSFASDPCASLMCMGGQLSSESGGSSCDTPIADFYSQLGYGKHGISLKKTAAARESYLNSCDDSADGGSNAAVVSEVISKFGKIIK